MRNISQSSTLGSSSVTVPSFKNISIFEQNCKQQPSILLFKKFLFLHRLFYFTRQTAVSKGEKNIVHTLTSTSIATNRLHWFFWAVQDWLLQDRFKTTVLKLLHENRYVLVYISIWIEMSWNQSVRNLSELTFPCEFRVFSGRPEIYTSTSRYWMLWKDCNFRQ